MTNFVQSVVDVNLAAGNDNKFNPQKLGLYFGLICEEFSEGLIELIEANGGNDIFAYQNTIDDDDQRAAFIALRNLYQTLKINEKYFKTGLNNALFDKANKVTLLDSNVDVAVVSLGAAHVLGADVVGAANNIAESNLSKVLIDANGTKYMLKDENGKYLKPDTYVPPSLEQFLPPTPPTTPEAA